MVWKFLKRSTDFHKNSRQNNQRRKIINLLLIHKELSIPEICQFLKLSIPTGTKLIDELEEKELLINSGKRESSGGRRPATFILNPEMGFVIAIEILLESIKVNVLNLEHQSIYAYESNDFNISDKQKSLDFLCNVVPFILQELKISQSKILGVGIGITGRVNAKKGISYTYLNLDTPLVDYLYESWGIPVFIENDTHLQALGENSFGLAKNLLNVICVNISKGLAISVISEGKLHVGHSGFAGEFGHIFADKNGRVCVCGKTGCLETIVSGLALELNYNRITQINLEYKKIISLIEKNEISMHEVIQNMGQQLGKSLAVLIDLLNPELIIIGGGFMPILESMRFSINKGINLHSLPQLSSDCEIKISKLGENAHVLGAFALVTNNLLSE